MKKIEELSRKELLGLIYHIRPDTLTGVHPCVCACCGDRSSDEGAAVLFSDRLVVIEPYFYVCDSCENALSE